MYGTLLAVFGRRLGVAAAAAGAGAGDAGAAVAGGRAAGAVAAGAGAAVAPPLVAAGAPVISAWTCRSVMTCGGFSVMIVAVSLSLVRRSRNSIGRPSLMILTPRLSASACVNMRMP